MYQIGFTSIYNKSKFIVDLVLNYQECQLFIVNIPLNSRFLK